MRPWMILGIFSAIVLRTTLQSREHSTRPPSFQPHAVIPTTCRHSSAGWNLLTYAVIPAQAGISWKYHYYHHASVLPSFQRRLESPEETILIKKNN